jgi:hypothetical protein
MKAVRFLLTLAALVAMEHVASTQILPDRPFVVSSTFWGTAAPEGFAVVATDAEGSSYVAAGGTDVTLTKFNSAGAVVYFTRYGINTFSTVTGIAVDAGGHAVITGYTVSSNLPAVNAIQPSFTFGGCGEFGGTCADAFVARFSPGGGSVLFSSYLGTVTDDRGSDVDVDALGNIYVIGTSGAAFPGAVPIRPHAGGTDAFVVKIPPGGRTITWATYLGGWFEDDGNGIDVDTAGNAYLTGVASSDFPVLNPFQAGEQNYSESAFVAKLRPSGTLVYSTRLGGVGQDAGFDVAADSAGRAHVVGVTGSTNFPLMNPSQPFLRGFNDAFVTRFSPSGSSIEFSTYLGGAEREMAVFDFTTSMKIALDGRGNTYVSGSTLSPDFPAVYPVQAFGGGQCVMIPIFEVKPCPDAFVSKFDNSGRLTFSSTIGGSRDDRGRGVGVRNDGTVIVTGTTNSPDFPVRFASQSTYAGSGDGFITRIATEPPVCLATPIPIAPSGGINESPSFSWQPVPGAESYTAIAFSISDVLRTGTPPVQQIGTTTETSLTPSTPLAPGDYSWQVAAWNRICGFSRLSSPVAFTLPGTCPAPTATLVSPIDGAAMNNPAQFEWTLPGPSVAAVSIVVVLLPDGRFVAKHPSFGTTLTLPETQPLTRGTYTWFVLTWSSTCGLTISSPATFTGTGQSSQ